MGNSFRLFLYLIWHEKWPQIDFRMHTRRPLSMRRTYIINDRCENIPVASCPTKDGLRAPKSIPTWTRLSFTFAGNAIDTPAEMHTVFGVGGRRRDSVDSVDSSFINSAQHQSHLWLRHISMSMSFEIFVWIVQLGTLEIRNCNFWTVHCCLRFPYLCRIRNSLVSLSSTFMAMKNEMGSY